MQIDMIYINPYTRTKNYANNQFILKWIWSFIIKTIGFDFENHNTPHALMDEKFMQDFLPDPNFFLIFYRTHITWDQIHHSCT